MESEDIAWADTRDGAAIKDEMKQKSWALVKLKHFKYN